MIKLFKFLKGSAVICAILAPLVMCLEVAMDLLQPTLLSNIIDIGIANQDLNYVLITGLKMIIAAIIGLFAGAACSFLAYKDIILLSNPWKTREIKQYQQILRCKKVTFEQGRCLN